MASSADRAASESGVAGLGSESMATLYLEWLEPLLERIGITCDFGVQSHETMIVQSRDI